MPEITEDIDNAMEKSNVKVDKTLLITLSNEYMHKFHEVMLKFNTISVSDTIRVLLDKELKGE